MEKSVCGLLSTYWQQSSSLNSTVILSRSGTVRIYVVTNLHLVIVFVACRKGGLKRVAPGADELVKYSFV